MTYYSKNKERILQYNINYYWTHHQEKQIYNAMYWEKNKEKILYNRKQSRKNKPIDKLNNNNMVRFN